MVCYLLSLLHISIFPLYHVPLMFPLQLFTSYHIRAVVFFPGRMHFQLMSTDHFFVIAFFEVWNEVLKIPTYLKSRQRCNSFKVMELVFQRTIYGQVLTLLNDGTRINLNLWDWLDSANINVFNIQMGNRWISLIWPGHFCLIISVCKTLKHLKKSFESVCKAC